jgi:hypothetical protein
MKIAATTLIIGTILTGGVVNSLPTASPDYADNGTALVTYVNNNEVAIDKHSPAVALSRWSGLEVLGVSLGTATPSNIVGSTKEIDNVIDSNQTAILEPSQDGQGFNVDIKLAGKPASNVFIYQLSGWEDMDFLYQPPLWQEMGFKAPTLDCTDTDCQGAHRPDNVVDSYAVYSKHKGHAKGQTNYQAGKLFHIYRPQATDAKGNTIWADLAYNNGVLTVTVPQAFLDSAAYPLLIDPTFGNTVGGGTLQCIGSDELETVKFTSPAGGGNITSISTSMSTACGGNFTAGNAIYSNSSNPTNLLAQDSGNVTVNAAQQYWTTNVSYTFTGSTSYWLTVFMNVPGTYYYDASVANMYFLNATFESYPNPWTDFSHGINRNVSIYATYTPTDNTVYPHVTVGGKASTIVGGGSGGRGGVAFLTGTSKESTDTINVTTDAIDTTGANFLVLSIGSNDPTSPGTISDSKGNSWTPLTSYGKTRIYYSIPTSVGVGHTFSNTSGAFPAISVAAFRGVKQTLPFDVENGINTIQADPEASGSITPNENNELIITAAAFGGAVTTVTTPSGFTLSSKVVGTPGVAYGSGIAYKIQTTAGAENPSWQTDSGAGMYGVGVASFKAATGSSVGNSSTIIK